MPQASHMRAALPYEKKVKAITALADPELSEGEITARDGAFMSNVCARVLREHIFRSSDLPRDITEIKHALETNLST